MITADCELNSWFLYKIWLDTYYGFQCSKSKYTAFRLLSLQQKDYIYEYNIPQVQLKVHSN